VFDIIASVRLIIFQTKISIINTKGCEMVETPSY